MKIHPPMMRMIRPVKIRIVFRDMYNTSIKYKVESIKEITTPPQQRRKP